MSLVLVLLLLAAAVVMYALNRPLIDVVAVTVMVLCSFPARSR